MPARPAPPAGRIQDPFAFRCLPQTLGPAYDAADALDAVLAVELSAAAENPLISAGDGAAYHHGNFYAGQLGLALDSFRLALLPVARSAAARLAALCEPAFTGPRPFLGDTATASSGVMILEVRGGLGRPPRRTPSPSPRASGTPCSRAVSRSRPVSPRSPPRSRCGRVPPAAAAWCLGWRNWVAGGNAAVGGMERGGAAPCRGTP
ncbi:aromatic amino acid lyase, partial [Streptomyces sp. SPB78]|uniref:aromatic amino acid lyase n=1 Tax=Streptomyces sp. (strain SPB78) TaxID=591157 RepID=UPI003B634F01